jgi:nitrate reductase gamma subunit
MMDSISLLYLLSYVAFLVFGIVFVMKAIKYATAPIHLRWELYPVAHEVGHKSGGSYLEELNWWNKPRKSSLFGEIKYMAREGLFFEKCYRNNRGLWYFTYPFHMGLLLLMVWIGLLFVGAITMVAGIPVAEPANAWAAIVYYLTLIVGIAGLVLGTFGCAGLIVRRTTNEELRLYTAPKDYFDLSFILAILLAGVVSWIFFDTVFTTAREFARGLITFRIVANVNPALVISIILFAIFLIYMPFTSLMHGLAKYFTYHRVVWEDEPNLRGSRVEKRVEELLQRPVTWEAPHIQPGKTWRETVSGGTKETE